MAGHRPVPTAVLRSQDIGRSARSATVLLPCQHRLDELIRRLVPVSDDVMVDQRRGGVNAASSPHTDLRRASWPVPTSAERAAVISPHLLRRSPAQLLQPLVELVTGLADWEWLLQVQPADV